MSDGEGSTSVATKPNVEASCHANRMTAGAAARSSHPFRRARPRRRSGAGLRSIRPSSAMDAGGNSILMTPDTGSSAKVRKTRWPAAEFR